MCPRLLIADRNRLVREALGNTLASEFEVIGLVGSGPEVFASFAKSPADIVLVDLCLPDLSGRQVVGGLRLLHRDLRIAAMFEHDGPEYRESLRDLGANGFLWKGTSLESFRAGLVKIAERPGWLAVPEVFVPGRDIFVSDFEHQVLECLVEYPIKAIGRRLGATTRRVEGILNRLRRRFGVSSNAELIRSALGLGYIVADAKFA